MISPVLDCISLANWIWITLTLPNTFDIVNEPVPAKNSPSEFVLKPPLLAFTTEIVDPDGDITTLDGIVNVYGLVKLNVPTPSITVISFIIFHGFVIETDTTFEVGSSLTFVISITGSSG